MKKVGILGGTFDPVHYGHLILAEQACTEANLDVVVFMPANIQPFKLNKKIAENHHRYEMLKEAIADNPKFKVSDMEINASEVSYTIKTLRDYKKLMDEEAELYFIVGTDVFLGLEKWYESETLLREYSFIVGTRPGYKEQELKNRIEYFRERYGTNIMEINNSEVEISSTDIKLRIKKGKSIKYLLPDSVREYISKNKLYV